jgi:uncharacterized membrane protein/thiol-disulfide isomerase/thioredoxin
MYATQLKNNMYTKVIKSYAISTLLILILLVSQTTPVTAKFLSLQSAQPVVRAILFYSPSCGHCHQVIEQDLPPILEKYGEQINIIAINVSTEEGNNLFRSAADYFINVREIRGVPTLVVGEQVLIGSIEIPQQLPGIIDKGLAEGGIDWPEFPGLREVLQSQLDQEPVDNTGSITKSTTEEQMTYSVSPTKDLVNENQQESETISQPLSTVSQPSSDKPQFIQKFLQDPIANSVSVLILIGMIISLTVVGYYFLRTPDDPTSEVLPRWLSWPGWVIPVLCMVGFGVAAYMSYVEITHKEAICGPLGDCNTVQQSPYATLWGFLPVGILGLIGYVSIGIVWLIHHFSSTGFHKLLALVMWGMALLGTLFSIYLTFLEAFVIGATCAWCITSAILITLLLWATTGPALNGISLEDNSPIFEGQ